MEINASEPVEVWLLESPQAAATAAAANVPGPTTPSSSLSFSERKKRRGSFFSKLFCSSDVDRTSSAKAKPSPGAESVDSQTSRRSTLISSSSPLASPSESSFGAEQTEPQQSMPALTTPPRSSIRASFSTPQRKASPAAVAAAARKSPANYSTPPVVHSSQAKGFYRKMSESSGDHEQSTDDRCSFHSASELASHDDDEFLPDEFKATLHVNSSTDRESSIPDRLYSADQVQVIVNEALHQAHEEWQQTIFLKAQEQYEMTIAKLRKDAEVLMAVRKEAEALLDEHGNLTARQHEDEIDELRKKLEEDMKEQNERHEQEKVDLQLELTKYKESEIQALQSTVSFLTDAASKEREDFQQQIETLQAAVDADQKQLAIDTELLRKELELSEAKNQELLDKQELLEKARIIDTAANYDSNQKLILELQAAVDAAQRQLSTGTESLRKQLELSEAKNLELLERQRELEQSKETESYLQDEASQRIIAELKAAVDAAQEKYATDTASLRKDLQLSEARNRDLLEKHGDIAKTREINSLAQDEVNAVQIAELKAALEAARMQLAVDTESLRKKLEFSEARNLELIEKQREIERAKHEDDVAMDNANLTEQTRLSDKIAELQQEKLRILDERDCELQRVREEAKVEVQRVKDELTQLMETERKSAERAMTEATGAETEQRLEALTIEHSKELDRRLQALQREHSEAIDQLKNEVDVHVLQVKRDKDIEFESVQVEMKSRLEMEWSTGKQELLEKISSLESSYAALQNDFESKLKTIQEAHANEVEQIQEAASEERDHLLQQARQQAEKARKESEASLIQSSLKEKQEIIEEVERLRLENDSLHGDLERTAGALKNDHSTEVAMLREQAEQTRLESVEEARRQTESSLLESHTKEKYALIASIEELKAAIEELRSGHERQVESLKQEHTASSSQIQQSNDEQLVILKREIDSQTKLAMNQAALLEQATNDKKQLDLMRETLEAQLNSLRATHGETIAAMTTEHRKQIEEFRKEADERVARVRAEASSGDTNVDAMAKEAKETSELVAKLQADLIALSVELDHNKDLLKQSSEKEKSLVSKVTALEARTEADRTDFERQLIERQELTNKEIEETIAQLDLLVAEHNQEKASLERSIQDKDAIIAALGAQLAEAQRRMSALEEAHMQHARELESSKHDVLMAQEAIESLKSTIEHLKTDHKKSMEAEHTKRLQAIEQAREETIADAESQFQRANDIYIQLKKEYDASCHKISKLESEVKHARLEVEQSRKDQASKEMELAAELAQVKARLATSEADSARQIQEYSIMLNQLQGKEKELTAKLDEAHATARTTHMTLAAVVAEKERLIRENEEMKAVCEELMGMIEAQQQQPTA